MTSIRGREGINLYQMAEPKWGAYPTFGEVVAFLADQEIHILGIELHDNTRQVILTIEYRLMPLCSKWAKVTLNLKAGWVDRSFTELAEFAYETISEARKLIAQNQE